MTTTELFRRLARSRAIARPTIRQMEIRCEILLELERRTGVWHSY